VKDSDIDATRGFLSTIPRQKFSTVLALVLLMALGAVIITLTANESSHEEQIGEHSSEVSSGKVPIEEDGPDYGFTGPRLPGDSEDREEKQNEKQAEKRKKKSDRSPFPAAPADEQAQSEPEETPFDSIRPYPNSYLPDHIDSMWFYISKYSQHSEYIDSISLIVKGKEMTLRPGEDDQVFFNTVPRKIHHSLTFRDLTLNGFRDVLIYHWASGASGNNVFRVFLYHEEDTTYRFNEEFSRYANLSADEDGYYYTMGTGGGRNFGGQIMVLDNQNDSFQFKPVVVYSQRTGQDPDRSTFQHMEFNFDTLKISYTDTLSSHISPVDASDFQSVFKMNRRVKYYNPQKTCKYLQDSDSELKTCTLSFKSRLTQNEVEIFIDLENMQLEVVDRSAEKSKILDLVIDSEEEDFKLTSAYLASAFSF